jgi:hypothetical protein
MPKLGKPVPSEDERKRKLERVAQIFTTKHGDTIARKVRRGKARKQD